MVVSGEHWSKWTREDWKNALFEHFFLDITGEDAPVHRIPVTRDELCKVVCDSGADPEKVQAAFVQTIRTRSHIEFNHRLSKYTTDPKKGWNHLTIPLFFADLAFSCLVASPPDEEVRDEGDFRNRLAILLGHDPELAVYPLERLASLWEAFREWLDWRRSTGEPYRRLELPPLDHRVRIGYSLMLAFPSRRDLILLTKLFSQEGFEVDPPLQAVFKIVGREIDKQKFSKEFRKAYEEFRDAYHKEQDLGKYPFWGAVREAIVETRKEYEFEQGQHIRRLKLVMESGGVVLLLSNVPGQVINREAAFLKVDTPYPEFANVLCLEGGSTPGVEATQKLLQGRFHEVLSGEGWLAIKIAIDQGVLLFRRTEDLTWELVFTKPEEGEYQGLISNPIRDEFLKSLPESQRPSVRPSCYRGWTELEHFPGEWLRTIDYEGSEQLTGIRCLQQTVCGPRLTFVGGCRIDGGYLGIPGCLPLVRAPMSDSVSICPVEPLGAKELLLQRINEDSADFAFPSSLITPLKGCYRVRSAFKNRVLIQKEAIFRPDIVVNSYACPTYSRDWEQESGGPDVISYDVDAADAPDSRETKRCERDVTTASQIAVRPANKWFKQRDQISALFPQWQQFPSSAGAYRLMEVLGGLAMQRRGIPENEILELVRCYLEVDSYELQWDIVRAWIESGYYDRLHAKRYRRTEYFARRPRFVLYRKERVIKGTLTGLATGTLRSRAGLILANEGARISNSGTFSLFVPPIPAWEASTIEPYIRASQSLGLQEPLWLTNVTDHLWSLSEIVSLSKEALRFYDLWGSWDWESARFIRDKEPLETGLEIVRFYRFDRAPYYQLIADGKNLWWTTSRNWALLVGYELRQGAVFKLCGTTQVVRRSKAQIYLPVTVGRHISVTSGMTPGPVSLDSHQGSYCYQFQDLDERSEVLISIWGGNQTRPNREMRRWAQWILALSRRRIQENPTRSVMLPPAVRKQLDAFPEIPEFRELSRFTIDSAVLPRLREGLLRFTKLREM